MDIGSQRTAYALLPKTRKIRQQPFRDHGIDQSERRTIESQQNNFFDLPAFNAHGITKMN